MTNEDYKKEIMKMLEEIQSNDYLRIIYTVTKTCHEKDTGE